MYRTAYQRGMLTIFFSVGSKPLEIWDVFAKDGYVSRFLDQDIKSMVLELRGNNVSTTYMVCPSKNRILGISMPFLVMIVKNLKKYFSFEVTILDETGARRRFRVSNFQSTTQILPMCTAMPIGLSDGWNQIQFNLAEFTRRAYKKQFVEVQKVKINANIRLRRIYFTERLIPEDELPPAYKLYFPLAGKGGKEKKGEKENEKPCPPQEVAVEKPDIKMEVIKSASKGSLHSIKKMPSLVKSQAEVVPLPEGQIETIPIGPGPLTGAPDGGPVGDAEASHSEGAGEHTDEGEKAASAAGEATEEQPPSDATPAVTEAPAEEAVPEQSEPTAGEAPAE